MLDPALSRDSLLALVAAQRAAGGIPNAAARRDSLRRLRAMVRAWGDRWIEAIDRDFAGRPAMETLTADLAPVLAAIDWAMPRLERWMRPRRAHVPAPFRPGRAWSEWHPAGCVGIMATWNFPVLLSLGPMVDVLAAGNRVMLKLSERAPRFGEALERALAECFALEEIAAVGGGPEVGAVFAGLGFDHLFFTGSAATGRRVMAAAAEALTPVTLELGGKSPAIVAPDYPLERAATSVAVGKFLNGGQVCLAPDYALAPRTAAAAFAERAFERAARMYPPHAPCASLVGEGQGERLAAAVAEAEAAGARVWRRDGVAPVVVLDPPPGGLLMREEIFGPVLPVVPYDGLDDAIALAQRHPDPLALYAFTRDTALFRRLLREIPCGGVGWNATILQGAMPDLPFGGVRSSGIGRYHGQAGFERFSRQVSVYKKGWFDGFTTMRPPHAAFATRMARRWVLGR